MTDPTYVHVRNVDAHSHGLVSTLLFRARCRKKDEAGTEQMFEERTVPNMRRKVSLRLFPLGIIVPSLHRAVQGTRGRLDDTNNTKECRTQHGM